MVGYYVVIEIVRYQIRKEKRAGEFEFNREMLTLKLPINPEGVYEIVEEGEIRYKGDMYDVVSTTIHGNEIHYYCYLDVEENHLDTSLNSHTDNNISGNTPVKKRVNHLNHLISKDYTPSDSHPFSFIPFHKILLTQHYYLTISKFLEVFTPPPQG
jgi:hypothetical protein